MAGSDISTNGTDTGADALRNADGQSPTRQFVAVNAQLASEEGPLPPELREDMDLVLDMLRTILGEYNPHILKMLMP